MNDNELRAVLLHTKPGLMQAPASCAGKAGSACLPGIRRLMRRASFVFTVHFAIILDAVRSFHFMLLFTMLNILDLFSRLAAMTHA